MPHRSTSARSCVKSDRRRGYLGHRQTILEMVTFFGYNRGVVAETWECQADIISKETGLMGEAKRRKKLDHNFGLNNYEITFFTKDESNELIKEKWSNTTKLHPPFTSFKFSYGSETIFGLAFVEARNGVIALDYEWIFNPETITRQERILDRFLESINQEMLKQLLLEIDIDLNIKELPELFPKSTEAKFNGL